MFYQRRDGLARQIAIWSEGNIERALTRLDRAMLDSRLHRAIEDEIIGQALQLIAYMAAAARR
jgi:hypothetical protein